MNAYEEKNEKGIICILLKELIYEKRIIKMLPKGMEEALKKYLLNIAKDEKQKELNFSKIRIL